MSFRALSSESRRPKRDQRSGAPVGGASIRSVSFSAGVRKPSVWRGRRLSLRATSSSSAWVTPARLLPFGKYWRRRAVGVLVRPALPGASGIAEVHLDAGLDAEPPVRCHLLSLIPGQRPAKLDGQRDDARLERFADRLGVGSLGQRDELAIAGLALDQGRDRRVTVAHQQVALPVPGNGPVRNLRRSLGDHHHPRDTARTLPAIGMRPGEALLTPGTQMPGELAPQHPTRLDVQRAVDRLVRDLHLLIVGV